MTGSGLTLQGIHKSFGAQHVINDLSFSVGAGEALGIIGPNGAGKSTLFGLITGVLRQDAGRILFDNKDWSRLSAPKRCQSGICRSYQVPQPFSRMTVFENLLVAASFGAGMSEREARPFCAGILQRTGLIARADSPASSLRLIERKRLELARALAAKPKLLLLDEIAGGLTDSECTGLVNIVRDIHQEGVSIIWIEHVVHALLAFADRLLVLNFGSKLADGPAQEVMANSEVRRVYMGIEA